jgi:hypothetical protein
MVNNSTNSNKTITSHLNTLNIANTTTYGVENPDPGLGQAQKCGSVKPVNGSPIPSDNWISDDNIPIHMYKQTI